jgi:chorismate dehydratase
VAQSFTFAAAKITELSKKIKVGSVSYLNTRPLVYGLKLPPINSQIELIEDNPAKLAEMLINDRIDLGLIPVAVIPELKQHFIIGDYCIGAEGEVASVCLFSEVPVNEINKVYLDYQSRSSVALLRWLMKEYWGIYPEIEQAVDDNYRARISGTTAGLVIGDRAFEQRKISTFIYDLAAEWKFITGLPFVFAAWVANKEIPADFITAFNKANAIGLDNLDTVIDENPCDLYDLKQYFTRNISYKFDQRKADGLALFLQKISAESGE